MSRQENESPRAEVTTLLHAWSRGDQAAFDKLAPIIYTELRRLARHYMARERRDHTLQPTALVHEAYMRLADLQHLHWKNRVHFYAISAQVMRRVLVDFARSRERRKRGGSYQRLSLEDCVDLGEQHDAALIALDDALTTLASSDARKCQVVEMKFFGGLSTEEIAESLHVSAETVLRDWKLAKLWLLRELSAREAAMTGERRQQVEEIVMSLLPLGTSERAARLDLACANDPELRREVESLLAQESRADRFLETPALEAAARALARDAVRCSGRAQCRSLSDR